ncbi:hypothetical protein F8388_018201 [Cannabis sativa]|uniref:WRKY domain-containing protein n=1 Tax=Cannabis sativa TaxID=3483 RepID=A0A7J6GB28_CANSA|nr:hypothetical protein F8388_018201 [Cannabis sativa]
MEEHNKNIVSLVLHGCKLAKEVELNLGDHQRNELANRCDEIAMIFSQAKEWLRRGTTTTSDDQDHYNNNMLVTQQNSTSIGHSSGSLLQELLIRTSSATTSIDHDNKSMSDIVMRGFGHPQHENRNNISNNMVRNVEILGSSSSAVYSQRPRKRKDDKEIRIVNMAAPQIGNTEIPPEDNYTWRKYGQKEIMGSKYPRSYYRCTHQKLYQCPAKKQVQRMDDDPLMFEVMYRGSHTCHMSATAPTSILPLVPMSQTQSILINNNNDQQLQPLITSINTTTTTTATSTFPEVPLGRSWLSMECSGGGGGGGGGGSSSSGGGSGSIVHDHFHPVLDLADVMFGSSSSSSMDFLFPTTSMEEDHNNKLLQPDDSENHKN